MKNDDNKSITNSVRNNISLYTSTMLCSIILIQKSFNMDKDLTSICMRELAARRENGDNFNFEQYLEDNKNSFPKFSMIDSSALKNILTSIPK